MSRDWGRAVEAQRREWAKRGTVTGMIVCSDRGTHGDRRIATFTATADGYVVTSGDRTEDYHRGLPGARPVRFSCPTCTRNPVFSAEVLHGFLMLDVSTTRRDISALEAALNG